MNIGPILAFWMELFSPLDRIPIREKDFRRAAEISWEKPMTDDLAGLSDDDLEARLVRLVADEKERTVEVISCLAELHRRHLELKRGYSSLFTYCTSKLGYTPDEAMRRITVARLSVKCEGVGEKLRQGEITISTVRLLSPVITPQNQNELLEKASGLSYREVEKMAHSLNPQAEKRDHIQIVSPKLPEDALNSSLQELPLFSAAPKEDSNSQSAQPQGPQETRIHFGFTGGQELLDKITRAKQLLWHSFPEGKLEDVIGAALEDLLDKRDPDRRKPPRKPADTAAAPPSEEDEQRRRRYIPLWLRADVWKRDGGRCAFSTSDGVRCGEESGLEYDHILPFALGGASDDPDNIRLLCRAHNQLLARETFGEAAVRPRTTGPAEAAEA